MPLAEGSLEAYRLFVRDGPGMLRQMVEEVAGALSAANDRGWIHRDIKPGNILRWSDGDWAVADWGISRRPRGQTTMPNRTQVGVSYGTAGFAAPELSVDAHDARTAAADIYSIGQVIGWIRMDRVLRLMFLCCPGLVAGRRLKACTKSNQRSRPQSYAAFLDLLTREIDEPPVVPVNMGDALLMELGGGRAEA